MAAMIDDLVDSARLETGTLELRKQPSDLLHLVCDLLDRVGSPQDRQRIHVEAPEPVPSVLADPQRLERAITNLLTNALKYSPADRPVTVRVEYRDGEALLFVTDRGVGIPPEDLPHLFQRHFRAQTAGQREGLGLGLYITRLIVEAHGGQVGVESEVGKGSTFCIGLPLA
jgi:signal transduction histidine kinase